MDAAEAVKERLNVEDVVGEYVALKRAGRNYKGLCPFHSEKTPSFMVNPDRSIFHCFGCNQGGDLISFVMKVEGLDFLQALELLARKAGVDLSQYGRGSAEASKQKDKLYGLLDLAAKYYQICLSRNRHALEYAGKARRLTKQTLTDFRIGYAPDQGTALKDFLLKRGHRLADLRQAGLLSSYGQTPRDLFRGRLILPLSDGQGRIVGFTGRLITEDPKGQPAGRQGPKYLNSPQTPVYDKSRHIFGLHLAKQAVRQADKAVLVEGNMDVVTSHQHGVRYVVATAGTAMTLEQLRQLARLTQNVILAFDNDSAGLAATLRAIQLSQQVQATISVADLAGGKDPDELIGQGIEKWQQVIDSAAYAMDWLFDYYLKAHDPASALGKRRISSSLLPVIDQLADPVEQDHYVKRLAEVLDVSVEAVRRRNSQQPVRKLKATAAAPAGRDDEAALTDTYLAIVYRYTESRVSLPSLGRLELDPARRAVLDFVRSDSTPGSYDAVPESLLEHSEFVKILVFKAEELYGSWSASDRVVEAINLAQRLGRLTKRRSLQNLSKQIEAAEQSGDHATASGLLDQYQSLLSEE
jgi:DNA primase